MKTLVPRGEAVDASPPRRGAQTARVHRINETLAHGADGGLSCDSFSTPVFETPLEKYTRAFFRINVQLLEASEGAQLAVGIKDVEFGIVGREAAAVVAFFRSASGDVRRSEPSPSVICAAWR
jgi:hypothetical protein